MKKGKSKNNFLFIMGISLITIIIFIVGFVTFYHDSSKVFENGGYIIYATDKESASYSFTNGTKYKTDLSKKIAFVDDRKKSVSVDSGSFVHYDDGSISFLQNGALLDLDKVNLDFVPYYNINNQTLITYEEGKYIVKGDKENLTLINWMGRVSDNKYIVAGSNLSLKIPGVTKTIDGDYFELIFMTDGVVKIDNKEVSYQVTSQDSYIYVGDNIKIDLGQNQIYYNNDAKMLISQITISGDENINLGRGNGNGGNGTGSGTSGGSGTGNGGGSGDGSGTTIGSGISSGILSSGVTSGNGNGDGSSSDGSSGSGGDGTGEDGDGTGGNGTSTGEVTTTSARIELIKLDVTSTSMNASLQMNRSSLISGNLVGYLTNISNGEREEVNISKNDGTFNMCSSGTNCYSFNMSLTPDNQYLLSIVDVNQNKQYFQKLITTSELGVALERKYVSANSISYSINFSSNNSVSQLDFHLYDEDGNEAFKQLGISGSMDVSAKGLKANSVYRAVINNISVCDDNDNCSFDTKYELSRNDTTLKSTPIIESIDVKKNTENASFDLSASVKDEFSTITKYIYTICEQASKDEEVDEDSCIIKEKTDSDALSVKVGEDIQSGVVYIYTFKVQYNDGEMDREVIYNGNSLFSMESLPYFQLTDKQATSNTISGKLSLIDPSCTVPIQGRVCRNAESSFTLRYYKLVDGEEKKTDIVINRENLKYDSDSGLYYYNLNLTNLAAETKYVIKVYGTYFLNGEKFSNVQIGDEIYAETSSTGNLKFVYSDNDSNDDNVINYNAKLSGGSKEEESDAEGEEEVISTKALNSIEKLTFDLYAGTYADDSETNNRHLGEEFVMTGNGNIKKNFCNIDTTSDVCNDSYNITNSKFGIDSLSELMRATGEINNFCSPKESFGCLATSYTIVVKGYDKAGNSIKIDNNSYTYNVTPSYYVSTQLRLHTDKKAIIVDYVKKNEFKSDDGYDFSSIMDEMRKKLKDADSYRDNLDLIADDTAVGIKVNVNIPQNYINSAYKYDKVVTNYYICNQNDEECNSESAIYTYSLENVNYSDSNHTFYLDDSKFVRGNTYKVMYELLFTASDGTVNTFSNSYTTMEVPIERQAPIYNFYIVNSTKNTITYGYNIKDVDSAIVPGENYFYYKIGDNDVVRGEEFTLDETRQLVITMCDDECNGTEYEVYLKERLLGTKGENTAIDSTIFDGEYGSSKSDSFKLLNFVTDNRLYIQLNDDDLGSRTIMYRIRLYDDSKKNIYDKYYLASMVKSCTLNNNDNDSIICESNPGDYRYLTVDYGSSKNSDIIDNIGKNISVTVDSYYDSGLIGIRQTFKEGLIFKNINKGKYLNIYGFSNGGKKDVIESEDNSANGVYMVDNGDTFDNGSVTLFHKLGLDSINNYSIDNGASIYTGNTSLINKHYNITYLQRGIKVGSYSNYDPKVISVSSLNYNINTFKFDSIIPKVKVLENSGINSISLKFEFTSVSESVLNSQFKSENGKYYLYVNLYDENGKKIISDKKVNIDLTNGTSTVFTDLDVETNYKYDIWAYMKSGSTYSKVQVYDDDIEYKKTTYETSTMSADELLNKLVYNAGAVGYENNGDSISKKAINYNVKVTNGNYLKIRLGLYDKDDKLLNFDGKTCGSDTNCYVEIIDASSNNVVSMDDTLKKYEFVTNDFVFGDNYYKLKVFAIPYYSNNGYDESKMLTLYDDFLYSRTDSKYTIDIHELDSADFVVNNFKSGYDDTSKYYVEFTVSNVKDPDFVMKNGEYHITLYDESGNTVYTVRNSNNKTIMIKSGSGVTTNLYDKGMLYSTVNNVDIKFPNLNNNTQYSIELSYETYRNNVSFKLDPDGNNKMKEVSPYTDYIYTPISQGITLGNVVINKESDNSFKLEYIGSNNLSNIKRVDYKVNLRGSTYSTSGSVIGNSIFNKSGNNYSLNVDLAKSGNSGFNFKTSGTYNVTVTYYTDEDGKNKVYSSTFSILV